MKIDNKTPFPTAQLQVILQFLKPNPEPKHLLITPTTNACAGRSWPLLGIVELDLGPEDAFPVVTEGGREYSLMWLRDPEEAVVFHLAHECRHLWQHEQGLGQSEWDAEQEAILALNKWRQRG